MLDIKVGGWAALAAATLVAIPVILPVVSPGLAELSGIAVLDIVQGVLFIVATIALRPAVFGIGSGSGDVAVVAAFVSLAAGMVIDLGLTARLPFDLVIVAVIVGQLANAGWCLLAARNMLGAASLRSLGWLGLAGSIAYLFAAVVLAYQVVGGDFFAEAVYFLSFVLLLPVLFLARLGWLALSGDVHGPTAAI